MVEESQTQLAADLLQDPGSHRIEIVQEPGRAETKRRPCQDLGLGVGVENLTYLSIGTRVPRRLDHVVEQRSLAAPGQGGESADRSTAAPLDVGQLAFPPGSVERQPGALHAVQEWAGGHLDLADSSEAGLLDLGPDPVGDPQRLDCVGRGVGDLCVVEVVECGVGELGRALALGLDAEVVVGGPGEAVEPGEPAAPLVKECVGQLGVPPAEARGRVVGLPDRSVEHAGIEVGVPGVGGDAGEDRTEQRRLQVAHVHHEGSLVAIGGASGHRHHPQEVSAGSVDRDLGVDGDPLGVTESLFEIGEL